MGQDLFQGLNEEQKQGVITTEGPVLILAGAGSGKTRVLTHRVAHLIGDEGVPPYRIMAITFTNKAAQEMRERIDALVGFGSDQIWVSTFHSACVRILRRFIGEMGYDPHFTIYDTDDSKAVIKGIIKDFDLDPKQYKERTFMNAISTAKDELIGPEEYLRRADGDLNRERIGRVYREYEIRLRKSNALDFDDIIFLTVALLKEKKEVREYYNNRIQYLMVDEYQDTNTAQFELVRLLAGPRKNLCVVGDDDQSIYKFRGANIYNILNFEDVYPEAKVIKLEQNYRSTQNILDVANEVISNNRGRKEKALWTSNGVGEKVAFRQFDSAYEEAEYIASNIRSGVYHKDFAYSDCAILYRTNAQSRILEEKLIQDNIPYKIIGGQNFYSRMEIKDMLAYLKVVANSSDEVAVRRIINIPKRGIGATTLTKVALFANANGLTFYEALQHCENIPGITRAAGKIKEFTEFIDSLHEAAEASPVPRILKTIIDQTGYVEDLRLENTDEAKGRIENIDELLSKAVTYQETQEEPSLTGFLEEVALIAEIDALDQSEGYVVLMTLHGAKGLEFPQVYMAGMEDGLFPGYGAIMSEDNQSELEEERRLCYVGITRAKAHLTMTAARARMIRGETQYNAVSRFVKEIPSELLDGEIYEPKSRDSFLDSIKAENGFLGSSPKNVARKNSYMGQASKQKTSSMVSAYSSKGMGTKIEKAPLSYQVGDRVSHGKFGEGVVTLIQDGGRDFEVTVDFDTCGTKKMFASFAKMEKI